MAVLQMANELSTEATLEIKVIANDLDTAIPKVGRFNEETGGASKRVVQLEKDLVRAQRGFTGTGQGAGAAAKGVAEIEKNAGAASKRVKDVNENLISSRYALYDVATTYGAISTGLLGVAAGATVLGAKYESAFTNVERTSSASGQAIQELRGDLVTCQPRSRSPTKS
jgi:hypothetical protein